jgi:hypothetical protein
VSWSTACRSRSSDPRSPGVGPGLAAVSTSVAVLTTIAGAFDPKPARSPGRGRATAKEVAASHEVSRPRRGDLGLCDRDDRLARDRDATRSPITADGLRRPEGPSESLGAPAGSPTRW